MPNRKPFLLPFLAFGLGACALPSQASDYVPGQGMAMGNFVVSGYANMVMESRKDTNATFSADDLSLFVSGQINRWVNPFIEAEISGLTLAQNGGGAMRQGKYVAERLYNDLKISDGDTFRIGKILTPVGDWNLIHAAPLVPISTRPLTTTRGFSEYSSGVSWRHESAERTIPDWQVYAQPGSEWLPRPNDVTPRHFRNLWGAHLNWKMGITDKVGVSLQKGELEGDGLRYTLVGGNVRKTFGRLRLEAEATYSRWSGASAGERNTESGAYLLGAYSLGNGWHAIAEAEHFQERSTSQPSNSRLLGVAWKPQPAMVWKLEYVRQTESQRDIPTGWVAAFSILF